MRVIRDDLCCRCLRPFTEKAWEQRHADPATGGDCHERCCPMCKGRQAKHPADDDVEAEPYFDPDLPEEVAIHLKWLKTHRC